MLAGKFLTSCCPGSPSLGALPLGEEYILPLLVAYVDLPIQWHHFQLQPRFGYHRLEKFLCKHPPFYFHIRPGMFRLMKVLYEASHYNAPTNPRLHQHRLD